MIKLVGARLSPFTRRVAVSLNLLDIPFEWEEARASDSPEIVRRYNPLGRIPALALEDGEVLIDSSAILDWLDERVGPERALLPPSGAERRRALRLIALGLGAAEKVLASVNERRHRPPENLHKPWLDHVEDQAAQGFRALEEACPEHGWLLGERLTQADVTAVCVYGLARVRVPHLLDRAGKAEFPRLDRLVRSAERLPAFEAAALHPTEPARAGSGSA